MSWKDIIKEEFKLPDLSDIPTKAAGMAKQIAEGSSSYTLGQAFYAHSMNNSLTLAEGIFKPKSHDGNIQVWSSGDVDLHIALVERQPKLTMIHQSGKHVWQG